MPSVFISIVNVHMLMLVSTFKCQILQLSSISNMNYLTILVATSDVKNSPVFTDLLIQACKSFITLATGGGGLDSTLTTCLKAALISEPVRAEPGAPKWSPIQVLSWPM